MMHVVILRYLLNPCTIYGSRSSLLESIHQQRLIIFFFPAAIGDTITYIVSTEYTFAIEQSLARHRNHVNVHTEYMTLVCCLE